MCQKAASIRGWYETRTVEWGCGWVQTRAAPFLKSLPTSFTLREFFILTDAQLNLAALSSLTPYRKRVNSATLLYGKHFRKVPRPSVEPSRDSEGFFPCILENILFRPQECNTLFRWNIYSR